MDVEMLDCPTRSSWLHLYMPIFSSPPGSVLFQDRLLPKKKRKNKTHPVSALYDMSSYAMKWLGRLVSSRPSLPSLGNLR